MRELIQSVHLGVGASSRRKVYIIDEVHMLSAAASNTLLKTLEEPPAHVVFVLATTDPQKVLPTLRSRTQHFEFTLLSHGQLVGHLADILGREGVETDPEALDLIARRAAGSARDALSLLDQALAVGSGRIDAQQVQSAFGGAPFEQRLAVLEAAAADDVAGALVGVHDLVASGHDVRRVADDLLRTLRDAFLQANASGGFPTTARPRSATGSTALAKEMGNPAVVRAIEILGDAIVDIRGQAVADPRLVLEVAVVRIARREARTREETLLDRVERLEQRLGRRRARRRAGRDRARAGAARAGAGRSGARASASAPRSRPPAAAAPDRRTAAPTAAAPSRRADAADGPPADPVTFALDDVIEAWPETLGLAEGAGARRHPGRAADRDRERDHRLRRAEAALRRDQRALPQGGRRRSRTRSRRASARRRASCCAPHDFDKADAFRPAPSAGSRRQRPEPARPRGRSRRSERARRRAADAPPPDSVTRLVADLGAEVIDERRRG